MRSRRPDHSTAGALIVMLLATSCVSAALHQRVARHEVEGTRFSIPSVLAKPVEVFVPPRASSAAECDLVIHFHGAAYIPMQAAAEMSRPIAIAVVHLGSGSSVYERAFSGTGTFDHLLEAIQKEVPPIRRVYLTGFSAGYGAIRAILRTDGARVSGVLLLDGLHTGYTAAGDLETEKMQPFRVYALSASAGRKRFLMTHSQIVPPDYASTSETADDLIAFVGAERKSRRQVVNGMQQLTEATCGNFRIFSFSGDTAADHIDHFHAYARFFRILLHD